MKSIVPMRSETTVGITISQDLTGVIRSSAGSEVREVSETPGVRRSLRMLVVVGFGFVV